MKDLIIKYKWMISTILIILTQIQELLEISPVFKLIIQISIITLTVFVQRAEMIDEINLARYNLFHYDERGGAKKPFIKITVHKMIWDLILKIPTDFKRENLTKEENIPSHLLIGGACLFLVMPLVLTGLPQWFALTLGGFSAIGVGMIIELIQVKFFDGIGSDRDVRWTWYGYYLFIPVYLLIQLIGASVIGDLITALTLIVIAFSIHPITKKNE
ncbi:hypothetical protein [Flavobacterium sp.]|uniref:hypothetical protein n=1 Tax=Flavobacterium sp. TaxID=239 RepID=UPI0025B7C9E1|nr:hypothetical protein [Flavobacterium sp.]MBA4154146.1 hypothetical protein [Flavobacterium sp.]